MAEYTYNVKFSEFVGFYQGISNIWIGDGSTPVGQTFVDNKGITRCKGGEPGFLYCKANNGAIDEIGYVSDYAEAKKYFEDHSITFDMTYEDWIEYIGTMPEMVTNAHLWAYGSDAGDYEVGMSAKEQADRAAMWAAGVQSGNGDVDNNAKYYANEAKGYANGVDLDGQDIPERAEDNASYYAGVAASAASTATDAAETASDKADEATSAVSEIEGFAEAAAQSASDASDDADTATAQADIATTKAGEAAASATAAEGSADLAMEWAIGPTETTVEPSVTNNSKYWSDYTVSIAGQFATYIDYHNVQIDYYSTQNVIDPELVPDESWSDSVTPTQGEYFWTRMKFAATTNIEAHTLYVAGYIGMDESERNPIAITTAAIDELFPTSGT